MPFKTRMFWIDFPKTKSIGKPMELWLVLRASSLFILSRKETQWPEGTQFSSNHGNSNKTRRGLWVQWLYCCHDLSRVCLKRDEFYTSRAVPGTLRQHTSAVPSSDTSHVPVLKEARYRSSDSGIVAEFFLRDSSENAVGESGLDSGMCSILYFSMYGAATSQT